MSDGVELALALDVTLCVPGMLGVDVGVSEGISATLLVPECDGDWLEDDVVVMDAEARSSVTSDEVSVTAAVSLRAAPRSIAFVRVMYVFATMTPIDVEPPFNSQYEPKAQKTAQANE